MALPTLHQSVARHRKATAAGGGSSLLTGLISYWKLDEASGNRADSAGSNTLTDNNTVGSTTGKVSTAADFVAANSESLSSTSAGLEFADAPFTLSGWAWSDDFTVSFGFPFIINRGGGGTNQYELFFNNNGNDITWRINGATSVAQSPGGSALSTGTWYFIVAWHDADNDQIGLSVNNATPVTTSLSGGVTSSGGSFALGARTSNGTPDLFMDGRLDEWGIWSRVLTSDERTALYNSGSGTTYPF